MRTFYLLTFTLLLTLSVVGRIGFVYGAAPSATTLSPTNVTATSATLGGSVNPNGKSTIVDFASALPSGNPGYFSPLPSPPKNIGSGVVAVLVSYTLTGLTPSAYWLSVCREICMSGDIYLQNLTIPEFPNSILILIPLLALAVVKFSKRRERILTTR